MVRFERRLLKAVTVFLLANVLLSQNTVQSDQIPYYLSRPDHTRSLPRKLEEISGLSDYRPGFLACVHDEAGKVYIISTASGEIVHKFTLKKEGDFEGIQIKEDMVWIVRSDGKLFYARIPLKGETKVTAIKTKLKEENDVEGLAYDPETDCLLLACKGRPGRNKKEYKGQRALYRFDLSAQKLVSEPSFLIDLEAVKAKLRLGPLKRFSIGLMKMLRPGDGDMTFKPSGVAVHPRSGFIYVLSSRMGVLAMLNREGNFLDAVLLDPGLFRQAEGICFDDEGTLYICNEGENEGGILMIFKDQKAGRSSNDLE